MSTPGLIAVVIIGLLVVEAAVMVGLSRKQALAFRLQWIANGLAGLFFALALLILLGDRPTAWLLAALTGALLSHVADVALRWRLMDKSVDDV